VSFPCQRQPFPQSVETCNARHAPGESNKPQSWRQLRGCIQAHQPMRSDRWLYAAYAAAETLTDAPGIPNRLFPRPSPAILFYPIPRSASRPLWAVLRLAAGRSDMLPAWQAWRLSARLAGGLVAVRALRQPSPLVSQPQRSYNTCWMTYGYRPRVSQGRAAMQCASCGFENQEGMNFCIQCATPLAHHCPQCAFENPPQARFCGKCATPLTDQTPVPSPP
jgi:hypothetical protein